MTLSKYRHHPALAVSVLSLLLCTSGWAGIETVIVGADTVVVAGRLSPAEPGRLHEILPHEIDAASTLPALPITAAADGSFQLDLPRETDGRDRIYSRWKLGDHSAIYATAVSAAAAYPNLKPMVAKNRKGLGGIHPDPRLFQDLVDLGLGHITVNISLHPEFPDGQIRQLDQLLTFAHENGIVVTAILLVPPGGSVLTHPDCDPSGIYSLPNVTSTAGAEAFAASIRFLAERYCKPGAPHGRISHWIIGNEVDAGWVWTNAGEKTASEYMADEAAQGHRSLPLPPLDRPRARRRPQSRAVDRQEGQHHLA